MKVKRSNWTGLWISHYVYRKKLPSSFNMINKAIALVIILPPNNANIRESLVESFSSENVWHIPVRLIGNGGGEQMPTIVKRAWLGSNRRTIMYSDIDENGILHRNVKQSYLHRISGNLKLAWEKESMKFYNHTEQNVWNSIRKLTVFLSLSHCFFLSVIPQIPHNKQQMNQLHCQWSSYGY